MMLYRIVLAEDEEWPNMANGHVFIPGTLVVVVHSQLSLKHPQETNELYAVVLSKLIVFF
jgi:hypothetical protein